MSVSTDDVDLPSRESLEVFKNTVFRLLLVVLFSVFSSIVLLSELGKRVDFGQQLAREIDRIAVLSTDGEAERVFKNDLLVLQDRLLAFMTLGSVGESVDMAAIYCAFEEAKKTYVMTRASGGTTTAKTFTVGNCSAPKIRDSALDEMTSFAADFPLAPTNLRSELLLMILMTLCGIVGSCGAVLIGGKEKFALRRGISGIIIVGFGAGFFVYLVLKGGRAFFLFNSEISFNVVSNPFPMSLAAGLGGMFAKELFEKLNEWIEERLSRQSETPTSSRSGSAENNNHAAAKDQASAEQATPAQQPATVHQLPSGQGSAAP